MTLEFFKNVPSEVIIDIISRLPARTIGICKCVRKSWRDLLRTREFADVHLSKSAPGLLICQGDEKFKVFEFEDELDLEHNHELHYNLVSNLHLTVPSYIRGSVNGLLFFRTYYTMINSEHNNVFCICNPITREFIHLPHPDDSIYYYPTIVTYGFGVSKMTGQYKVVMICHEQARYHVTESLQRIPKSDCQVYTVGTGSWRRIALGAVFEYDYRSVGGTFLNGNLHWLVWDFNVSGCYSYLISCFNLETELFSTFSAPPHLEAHETSLNGGLVVLRDRLCLCDNTDDNEIAIWLMKDYGVVKSWVKAYVISKDIPELVRIRRTNEVVYPIKVFKDGDILMSWANKFLFYYSKAKNEVVRRIDTHELECSGIASILHTPSFLSLRSCFPTENGSSF